MREILLQNIHKIHTTPMGTDRIRKNLQLPNNFDVTEYCKSIILNPAGNIYKQGKNFYCEAENVRLTINSYRYTIITAHRIKQS